MTVLKTVTFEIHCHHQLISNRLSLEENRRIYAKCMGEHGHGHNYKIRVRYRGISKDADQLLEQRIWNLIGEPYDYKSLNEEFFKEGIQNPITSGEQIACVFADKLRKAEPDSGLIHLEIVETRKNSFFAWL